MRIVLWRMGFAGDVLFSTAAIEGIRRKYPKAHIIYGVWPQYANIVETNPHVSQFVHSDGPLAKARQQASKWWEISHEKYPLEFGEMHYWGKIHAMQAADLGLLDLDAMESFKPQVYLANTDIVEKPRGTKVVAMGPFSTNGENARLWGMRKSNWNAPNGVSITLFNGVATRIGGKWEFVPTHWPALVTALNEMGYQCVQLGGASDPRIPGTHDLCGRLSWRQSIGFLTQVDLCITIDSFLLHAAVARKYALDGSVLSEGTPTIALLGPTDGRAMFPMDAVQAMEVQKRYPRYVKEQCCPCFSSSRFGKGQCKHNNYCMTAITVDDILEKVDYIERNKT